MADYRQHEQSVRTQVGSEAQIDEGLRAYMLKVYNYMALGVAVTGIVALMVANMAVSSVPTPYSLGGGTYLTELGATIYTSPLRWVIMFAPLAFVMVLSFGINRLSAGAAQMAFWAFSAIMGLSISWIFLVYAGGSIAQVFFVTAATFGALSLWGYTTKRDLSGMGTFLFMGVIGLIIASIVNIFLASSAFQFAISVLGVLIFAGLTAYDTQRIKNEYAYVAHDGTLMAKSAIMGALSLYLDFVNMFMFLLSLFGSRE